MGAAGLRNEVFRLVVEALSNVLRCVANGMSGWFRQRFCMVALAGCCWEGFKDLDSTEERDEGAYLRRGYAAWGWEVSVLGEQDAGVRRGSGDPAPLRAGGGSITMSSVVSLGYRVIDLVLCTHD
jgi:hypothetical protein